MPIIGGIILLVFGIFMTEHYELAYKFSHIDKGMHFAGGIIAAWFSYVLLRKELDGIGWVKGAIIIIACVALIGVLWEFAEYAATSVRFSYPNLYRYFHGGDLQDTIGDLIADLLGSCVLAIFYVRGVLSIDKSNPRATL